MERVGEGNASAMPVRSGRAMALPATATPVTEARPGTSGAVRSRGPAAESRRRCPTAPFAGCAYQADRAGC